MSTTHDWTETPAQLLARARRIHARIDQFGRDDRRVDDHEGYAAFWTIAPKILDALEAALDVDDATSDGYHTFAELYEYQMLYNAHAARGWLAAGIPVMKSWRHSDGEPCFDGGWFVVVAQLPTGQVSNHYPAADWDLFDVPEVETAPVWDGHTPREAARRLREALTQEATR